MFDEDIVEVIAKIRLEMKSLEPTVTKYRKPANLTALKVATLEGVWGIFSESVIKPEAAPFVVGRIYQALDEYRGVVHDLKRYDELEERLIKAESERIAREKFDAEQAAARGE